MPSEEVVWWLAGTLDHTHHRICPARMPKSSVATRVTGEQRSPRSIPVGHRVASRTYRTGNATELAPRVALRRRDSVAVAGHLARVPQRPGYRHRLLDRHLVLGPN